MCLIKISRLLDSPAYRGLKVTEFSEYCSMTKIRFVMALNKGVKPPTPSEELLPVFFTI